MNLFNQNYYMQIHTHSKLQLEKKNKKQKKPKKKTKQNKTKKMQGARGINFMDRSLVSIYNF